MAQIDDTDVENWADYIDRLTEFVPPTVRLRQRLASLQEEPSASGWSAGRNRTTDGGGPRSAGDGRETTMSGQPRDGSLPGR